MLADLITDFFRDLALAALEETAMLTVVNDGPPARFVVMDPRCGMTFSTFAATGETLRINRSFRLLIEPIDHVAIRPLCIVHQRWRMQ